MEQTVFTGADLQAQVAAAFGLEADEENAEGGRLPDPLEKSAPKGLGLGATAQSKQTLSAQREEQKAREKLKRKVAPENSKEKSIASEELSTWAEEGSDNEAEDVDLLHHFHSRKQRIPLVNQLLEETRRNAPVTSADRLSNEEEGKRRKGSSKKKRKKVHRKKGK